MAGLLQGSGDAEAKASLTHVQGSSRLLDYKSPQVEGRRWEHPSPGLLGWVVQS